MLDYLVNYGVQHHAVRYEDIDITDKMQLQSQINEARKNYFNLLQLFDDVQGKFLDVQSRMAAKSKEIIAGSSGGRTNTAFAMDDEYIAMEAEQQALKAGMTMISSQIEFYKSDLKVLNSVSYTKF